MGEIERRFPDYAIRINPKPVTIAEASASLAKDEALIVTHVADNRLYLWAVPKNGTATMAAVDLGRARLANIVADKICG